MTLDLVCRYFLLFFFCSMLGWLMEVTCKLFQFHRFINRGFLIGPYCPIYGFGAVFVTLLLSGFSDHPIAVFLLAMLVCGTLEYVTSYVMEKLFHARWWDYSQRKFNLNGRVCANTLIPFGLLGLVMVYFLKPLVFGWFDALSETALYALSGSLAALHLTDRGAPPQFWAASARTLLSPRRTTRRPSPKACGRRWPGIPRWCAAPCAPSPMPSCITARRWKKPVLPAPS